MLCIGKAIQSSWVVCLSFPFTFCPPGSSCFLDLLPVPLSSSTASLCLLTLVYSHVCQASLSGSSHISLFLHCSHMFKSEIYLGIVILAMNFHEPIETLFSFKFLSPSEGLITFTVISRIKLVISVFKIKKERRKPFQYLVRVVSVLILATGFYRHNSMRNSRRFMFFQKWSPNF